MTVSTNILDADDSGFDSTIGHWVVGNPAAGRSLAAMVPGLGGWGVGMVRMGAN